MCWDGEVVSTSGPWSPRTVASLNERDFWPRIKGQKWLEGRLISSSRFYSLRIKQKPKLLKLRSRLSWIHARVPWTGVPLLSGSRDPLCSSWTPRRSEQLDTTPKHPGDVYVSFIPRHTRAVHLQLSPRIWNDPLSSRRLISRSIPNDLRDGMKMFERRFHRTRVFSKNF